MSTFIRWLSIVPCRWPVLGLGFLFVLVVTFARMVDGPSLEQYAQRRTSHEPERYLMGPLEDPAVAYKLHEPAAAADSTGDDSAEQVSPTSPAEVDPGQKSQAGAANADTVTLGVPTAMVSTGSSSSPANNKASPPKAPSQAAVREAQRLLNALGFDAGPVDGMFGEKTRRAVIAFRTRSGKRGSDDINGALLAELNVAKGRLDEERARVAAANSTGEDSVPAGKRPSGVVAAVLTGVQRALGNAHDSVRDPKAFYAYCKAIPDTWIYDEGTQQMVFCGNIVPASERRTTSDAASAAGDR